MKNNIENTRSQTPDQRDVSYTGIAIKNLQESIAKKTADLEKLKIEIEELGRKVASQQRMTEKGLHEVNSDEQLLDAVIDRANEIAQEIRAESINLANLQKDVHEVGTNIFTTRPPQDLPPT